MIDILGSRRGLLLAVLGAALAMAGCKGSEGSAGPVGPTGPQGPSGPSGPEGPHGTFSNNSCVDCHHMSNEAIAMGVPIRPHENGGTPLVTGATKNNVASFITADPGAAATLTVLDSFSWKEEDGTPHTVNVTGVYWQYMDGLPSTITSGTVTSKSIGVTIPTSLVYKDELAKLALNPGTLWDTNRYRVVPVNDTNMSLATESRYLLTVFGDDGKVYWDLIAVKASDANLSAFAPVHTTGEPVVPIKLPVLITGSTGSFVGGTTTWSLSARPTSSTAALSDAGTAYPYFTPDVEGKYTVTDNNTGKTVDVYAGTWRGVLTGPPSGELLPATTDAACKSCHNVADDPLTEWNGDTGAAPDKFTPWSNTGHAKRFTQGLNDSGVDEKYGTSCFPCHTVGYVATAKGNGGFHDQPGFDDFVTNVINPATAPDPTRYATAWANPSYNTGLMQRTNIQCEQCHGPQTSTGAHGAAGKPIAGTRESLDSNVCGLCHGAATHHTRFQTWKESATGHGNYDLSREIMASSSKASCVGCHTAQGNLIWTKQLVNGNPLRNIDPALITWTADTVQPQTCAVCHDPHNVGTESDDPFFTPEQVNNDAQPRIALLMKAKGLNPGDTPKLPAGFKATGVGKGGQCMVCHNSRNGGSGTDAFLHEDNDPVFGGLTSYAEPHVSAQGDVLMGHNAYFVEATGGDASALRSPHSTLPDTCVTCHMEKTPPPYWWTENDHGTNHTFKADIGICTQCHGVDSGLGSKLRMDIQGQLEQLKASIEGAIVAQATGAYAGTVASVSVVSFHGSPTLVVKMADASTPPDQDADGHVAVTKLVPIGTFAGQSLAKAMWNYFLVENDASMGVHNPNFIRKVLGNSYEKVAALQ